jgi:hypothetical protein
MVAGVETTAEGRETMNDGGLGRLVVGVKMLIADAEYRLSSHCMAATVESVSEPGRTSRMCAEKWLERGEVATGAAWYGIEMRVGGRGQVFGNDSSRTSQHPLLGQKHQLRTDARGQA